MGEMGIFCTSSSPRSFARIASSRASVASRVAELLEIENEPREKEGAERDADGSSDAPSARSRAADAARSCSRADEAEEEASPRSTLSPAALAAERSDVGAGGAGGGALRELLPPPPPPPPPPPAHIRGGARLVRCGSMKRCVGCARTRLLCAPSHCGAKQRLSGRRRESPIRLVFFPSCLKCTWRFI